MAHSPAVLGGFLDLNRHAKRAKLDRRIGELISIAVQARLGCSRCLQAHSDAARTLGLTDDDVEMARDGSAFDPAWAAMVEFGLLAYLRPSAVNDGEVERLRALGFTDREIADVVAVVTIDVLTGTFNLVSGLSAPVPDRS